jgi:hypothetical protein
MGSRDASQLKQKYKYMCKRGERVKFDSDVEVLFTAADDETIREHITSQMQHAKGAQQQMQMWVELAARMNRSRQSIQTRWEEIRPPPPVAPVVVRTVPRVRKTPASRNPPRVTTHTDEEEEDDDGAFSDESVDEASPVVSAAAVVRRMPSYNKERGNVGGNTSDQQASDINRGRVARQASDQEDGDDDVGDEERSDDGYDETLERGPAARIYWTNEMVC